ncbi:MAG: UDP-N-acetylmuramoylalanyl-D-glutamate--2,6-diaminopimelate ligase [Treponematales bacterium]
MEPGAVNGALFAPGADPLITGLQYDSRKVKPGNLFFALSGLHADGSAFIADAVRAGAAAVVHQCAQNARIEGAASIRVKDSRFAMSPIAAAFFGEPSRRLAVIGVTGTEGKSTTVYLIYQLLQLLGKRTGFISTVQHGDGVSVKWNSEHQTTPEAPAVHGLLAEMRANGAEYAVVEASSHGLSPKTNRLGDVAFDAGVMTNVTHEHLEFHGTWEQYRADKTELFRALDRPFHDKLDGGKAAVPCFGVVNADDKSAAFFAAATKRRTYTFSVTGTKADLSVKQFIESGRMGNRYEVSVSPSGKAIVISDNLPGAYNAGNVLSALLAVSNIIAVSVSNIAPLVPSLKPVRGRMTPVDRGQNFEVIVDYAHTPSSFRAMLPLLRSRVKSTGGRLIALFGSAGERDTQKRPEQGRVAAEYADIVILTDEDPRGEKPEAILEDIASGAWGMARGETLFLIPSRPLAIRKALSLARKGDLVLLLGKGHENSIIYGGGVVPYDEIGEAEKALDELLGTR